MTATTTIRIAGPAEAPLCLEILTRAFEADPVCQWAWADRAAYRQVFPRFCRAFGGAAFAAGTAHVDERRGGVALWLAPGATPDEEALVRLIQETAPEERQAPLFSLFEQMDAYHPKDTHWHLPLIGVDPVLQARGIGSALLRHALEQCDRECCLAYLEATSAANARLYERHGFEAIGLIQAADSPPIVPMTRQPRGR